MWKRNSKLERTDGGNLREDEREQAQPFKIVHVRDLEWRDALLHAVRYDE